MKRPLKVAIVGTGPAGMYALEHLLEKCEPAVEVDLFERLPVPWGLVRYGVAPDHPEKKLVADRLFSYFLGRREVRYFGNVQIGKDISHAELTNHYDGVIYAVGANSDTRMQIPGETLTGCYAAREFVAWYNGHPDYRDYQFDLSSKRAVIVGNGNVALDVARILTLSIDELQKTDIADHALEALRQSQIEEVVILGRRGYLQGAFNNPELEELEYLEGVEVVVELDGKTAAESIPMPSDGIDWETRRKLQTLQRLVSRDVPNASKRIVFKFLSSPKALDGNTKLEQMTAGLNQLTTDEQGKLRATATGEETHLETGLVLRAIGYRGQPVTDLPFDEQRGVITNTQGRVAAGTYVTGWIKRGAQGIIGTNKQCADETVGSLLSDAADGLLAIDKARSENDIPELLRERNVRYVDEYGWRQVDFAEREQGRAQARPRVKLCNIDEMLALASGQ